MIPATVAPSHSIGTLDRIAFCKSVREKRKQLQLNLHSNGKDNSNSSTENAFLTQMLQSAASSTSSSSSGNASTSVRSSLDISSLLRKNNYPLATSTVPSSHRTVTSTLSNILPALLNGTIKSPRSGSPSTGHVNSPKNLNMADNALEMKLSHSVPVSPAIHSSDANPSTSSMNTESSDTSSSPPRCRSYPMAALVKRSTPPISSINSANESITTVMTQSIDSPTSYLLASASSCPALLATSGHATSSSTSPSLEDAAPKIVRSASVKSCASDSGVSSSSPLSDNNIVHVFRNNQTDQNHQSNNPSGSRKRKSLAHFYDELNRDKKFSTEATVSSGFAMPATMNNNIPYSQQEALAIGYAQYALMHTLTQQLRANYPAALLHAAAASGYLPLSAPMMAAAAAVAAAQGNKPTTTEKPRERRKVPSPESDNNNNHIPSNSSFNDQPYRRETYQTLLESSRLIGQQKLMKPVPIDLRKNNNNRISDSSPALSNSRFSSSSSGTASPPNSPSCISPPKSTPPETINDYVCIPKKLMPVIGARINDWLERNVNFVLSLSSVQDTLDNDKEKYLLLTRIWHRLLLISMVENSFEIYVTKDLQISNESSSTPTMTYPTETDVKQIESLISRGKILEIDECGFNLIREVITYKEGKTLFNHSIGHLFEKAECQAQARLTAWCSTRSKYSKVVFFLCNIYQVKEDIFERLFCMGSMHQSTPIQTHLQRFLASSTSINA